MAFEKALGFFRSFSVADLLGLAAPMECAVLFGHALLVGARLLLARLPKAGDFSHRYFLRKASSETTSAPFAEPASAAAAASFAASAGFFFGSAFLPAEAGAASSFGGGV